MVKKFILLDKPVEDWYCYVAVDNHLAMLSNLDLNLQTLGNSQTKIRERLQSCRPRIVLGKALLLGVMAVSSPNAAIT
jgi:hypothetical protein